SASAWAPSRPPWRSGPPPSASSPTRAMSTCCPSWTPSTTTADHREEMTMPVIIDSDIEICEFIAGKAFTAPELEVVNTYVASVAGVWDSFDCLDADSIREFGQRLVDELKGYLVTWGDRIAELRHRLTVCGGQTLSAPARRFIDMEAGRWRESHRALTGAVLDYMGVG